MISLENEIHEVRDLLGDATANRLIAHERREVFSLHPEIRFLAWAGASLLAAAAATFLAEHHKRLGPVLIAAIIALAAGACYAFVSWRRARASVVDDYVLLLGALLVSADGAYLHLQFSADGPRWYLLIVAVMHAVTAYTFDSRLVLALSISSLAAFLDVPEAAWQTFVMTAIVLVWTLVDRQLRRLRTFDRTFEHIAANLALLGGVLLMNDTRLGGMLLTVTLAAVIIAWGVHVRAELFALYAIVYAVIAIDWFVFELIRDEPIQLLVLLASAIGALVLLFVVHGRFRRLA